MKGFIIHYTALLDYFDVMDKDTVTFYISIIFFRVQENQLEEKNKILDFHSIKVKFVVACETEQNDLPI